MVLLRKGFSLPRPENVFSEVADATDNVKYKLNGLWTSYLEVKCFDDRRFIESFANGSYICKLTYFGQITQPNILWN